jgi:hypothetical protein
MIKNNKAFFDENNMTSRQKLYIVLGCTPVVVFLFWIVLLNFVSAPNEAAYRLAKARAMVLSRAIIEFKKRKNKDPDKLEELFPYLIKLRNDPSAHADDMSNYFQFSISGTTGIGNREPKGKPLQAGFGKLQDNLVVIGLGPTGQPVSFPKVRRNYLLTDDESVTQFIKTIETDNGAQQRVNR